MKTLENRIIENVRNIVLNEEIEDLNDEYFKNKLEIFKVFENFEMSELTKENIDILKKLMNEIENETLTEKKLEEFRKKYKEDKLIDRYERLSFAVYDYAKKELAVLNEKTKEEKEEILRKTLLIHNYLRDFSFAVVADAVADLKLACKGVI